MPLRHEILGELSRGILFILSAPAGTGKTTLIQKLKEEFPCIVQSISSTTRQPRVGERHGVDYLFLDRDIFEEKISSEEFLEHVELYGDYYGTSKVWVEENLKQGKHVFLVIDTQGALQLQQNKNLFSGRRVSIFVLPPSLDVLRQRLQGRGSENAIAIERRLAEAEREIAASQFYDYRIVNDHFTTAYDILRSIVIAEEHKIIK